VAGRGQAARMRDGDLRGAFPAHAIPRQMHILAAFVAAGGSVHDAAELVGIRPSTVKRHLADLRARSGLSTEQLHLVRSLDRHLEAVTA
jgi:DNA-binding NarL/FixJ family response regulator